MNNRVLIITTCLIGAGLLALAIFVSVERKTVAAEPPNDPAHAAHAAGAASQAGGQTVDAQLAELHAKMQRLESTMQQPSGSSSGAMPKSGKPGMKSGTKPMQGKMAGMSGMGEGKPPSGGASGAMKPAAGTGGMGGGASPPGGEMGMMGMMTDRMKAMKDKMTGGMGGGAPAAGAPMGEAAPGGGMGMGMMDMDKMEMPGMMGMVSGMDGKGGSRVAMSSALPGFPGASHLYHVGATGFFLDHPQHIALSTEQQMMLNQIKEKAALDKASAGRCVQEAEQDLWTLTAADRPDNAQIEAKIAEIEKLRGDARLQFIRSVVEAAKVLSDEQRQIVTGMASPAQPATGSPGPHKH